MCGYVGLWLCVNVCMCAGVERNRGRESQGGLFHCAPPSCTLTPPSRPIPLGCGVHGAEFYVENVFEELDAPGEWFYNITTQTLYVNYNGTGAPPASTQVRLVFARGPSVDVSSAPCVS
jgi:hypothetical protein